MSRVDLLGRPLSAEETELLEIYERLKRLAGRDELAPCVQAGARMALAVLWNAVNDLDLAHEPLDALGA